MGEIYLVRHGQVALEGPAYDGLSPLGERQAEAVGSALRARSSPVSRVLVGSLQRHHETARLAVSTAGWTTEEETQMDWNEVDHVSILAAAGVGGSGARSLNGPDTLRRFFGTAVPRWSSGLHDADYPETFTAFTGRVTSVFDQLCRDVRPGEATVVFTSAGVIGQVAVSLIGAGEKQWLSLIPVAVNGGITRVRVTSDGPVLMSYNEHAHLSPEQVTYR